MRGAAGNSRRIEKMRKCARAATDLRKLKMFFILNSKEQIEYKQLQRARPVSWLAHRAVLTGIVCEGFLHSIYKTISQFQVHTEISMRPPSGFMYAFQFPNVALNSVSIPICMRMVAGVDAGRAGERTLRARRPPTASPTRSRQPLITSRLMLLYYYISSSDGPGLGVAWGNTVP